MAWYIMFSISTQFTAVPTASCCGAKAARRAGCLWMSLPDHTQTIIFCIGAVTMMIIQPYSVIVCKCYHGGSNIRVSLLDNNSNSCGQFTKFSNSCESGYYPTTDCSRRYRDKRVEATKYCEPRSTWKPEKSKNQKIFRYKYFLNFSIFRFLSVGYYPTADCRRPLSRRKF